MPGNRNIDRFDWSDTRRSRSRLRSSNETSRSRSDRNLHDSYYEEEFYDDSLYTEEVVKYECQLCMIQTTCQVSLDSHMRGKGHLKRELIMQERMKENAGEKCQTSAWEKERQNNYERQKYSELKKNMTILQNMYQAKVKELNDYKVTCDKQRKELKELKDILRWHEKHITKVEFKDRSSFVYEKGTKCEDSEYVELGTQFLMQKVKKEVKNEDIKFVEIGTHDVFEDLKDDEREEFGTHVFEERKERVKKEEKNEEMRIVQIE